MEEIAGVANNTVESDTDTDTDTENSSNIMLMLFKSYYFMLAATGSQVINLHCILHNNSLTV